MFGASVAMFTDCTFEDTATSVQRTAYSMRLARVGSWVAPGTHDANTSHICGDRAAIAVTNRRTGLASAILLVGSTATPIRLLRFVQFAFGQSCRDGLLQSKRLSFFPGSFKCRFTQG